MPLDLNTARTSTGEHSIEVLGESLTFRFRRPSQRAWLEVLPAMSSIEGKLRAFTMASLEAAGNPGASEAPRLVVPWSDVQAVRGFVLEFIHGVDGLEDGGEPVSWSKLEEPDRVDVLELLDFNALLALASAILNHGRLSDDQKKTSVST